MKTIPIAKDWSAKSYPVSAALGQVGHDGPVQVQHRDGRHDRARP